MPLRTISDFDSNIKFITFSMLESGGELQSWMFSETLPSSEQNSLVRSARPRHDRTESTRAHANRTRLSTNGSDRAHTGSVPRTVAGRDAVNIRVLQVQLFVYRAGYTTARADPCSRGRFTRAVHALAKVVAATCFMACLPTARSHLFALPALSYARSCRSSPW